MAHWRCISGCGACCRLDPALRGEDLEHLSDEQRSTYFAMVGEDGWCIYYDTGGRRCRIYTSRPDFCRVENLMTLFAGPGDPDAAPAGVAPAPAQARSGSVQSGRAAEVVPQQGPNAGAEQNGAPLDAEAEALAIASCRTQIRAEYGGRGRVMKRFEQAIRRTP